MGECKSTTKTTSVMIALLFLIIDPCGKLKLKNITNNYWLIQI